MYYLQDAHSFWNWIYFVCLIIIGSYFMMNLCLVVISAQFSTTKKRETRQMLAEKRRFSTSVATVANNQQGSCWKEIIKCFERIWKRSYKRFRIFSASHRRKHDQVSMSKNL